MKTFEGIENKNDCIVRCNEIRQAGKFWGFGHYYSDLPHSDQKGGSVLGCLYHDHMIEGEIIQDVPKIAGRVHGIPVDVAHIIDAFFKEFNMNPDKEVYQRWAERCYGQIPEGVSLETVSDKMALHILETKELLSEYADARTNLLIGVLIGIYRARVAGVPSLDALNNLYHDEIMGLHRHQYQGKSAAHNALASVRMMTSIPLEPYAWGVLIHGVITGASRASGKKSYDIAETLAVKFLCFLREST